MQKFVKCPNLPENAVGVVLSCQAAKKLALAFSARNIRLYPSCVLPQPLSALTAHPDTQITHLKDNLWVASKSAYSHYEKLFRGSGIKLVQGRQTGVGNYPKDAAYNVAWVGRFAFHHFCLTDQKLLSLMEAERVEVRQGYGKCSVCIVDENSIITEDRSIARAAQNRGLAVLEISKGSVALEGMEYGFLGGASGKLAKNLLAFAGNIKTHTDYDAIYRFCKVRNVELLSLCDERLMDIGSILPIFEEE